MGAHCCRRYDEQRHGAAIGTELAFPLQLERFYRIAVVAAVLLIAPAQGRGAVAAANPTRASARLGFGRFTFDEPNEKNEFLADLLVLRDGKILGAGSRGGGASGAPTGFLLARFNSDGTPDLGFGGDGFRVEPDLEQAGDLDLDRSDRGTAATANSSSPAPVGVRRPDPLL